MCAEALAVCLPSWSCSSGGVEGIALEGGLRGRPKDSTSFAGALGKAVGAMTNR